MMVKNAPAAPANGAGGQNKHALKSLRGGWAAKIRLRTTNIRHIHSRLNRHAVYVVFIPEAVNGITNRKSVQ